MIKSKILQKDAPVLRKIARKVQVKDIKSKKIRDIIKEMKRVLYAEEDGVAIAAPQIGVSLQIFVVKGEALTMKNKKPHTKLKSKLPKGRKDLISINPEIIKTSKEKKKLEEGCLSVRWFYGHIKRSEKVTLKFHNETGKLQERGASGFLAQIFQHEIDHLNGILFIDNAENIQEIIPPKKIKFVFFGSSQFSRYVLEELEGMGFSPLLKITSARNPLPMEKLKKLDADVFVIASFGKILPKELIELPKYKTLNLHPSLLPELRGATPIQNTILGQGKPGITIMRLDQKIDHGPILTQVEIPITPWPDHYRIVEEKLARVGGQILGSLLSRWVTGDIEEIPQNNALATYTKLIKKEDGLLDLNDPAEENLRKTLAYSTWPGAYIFFKNKRGKEKRVIIKDAKIKNGVFQPTRVVPAGKKEMGWQDFLRGN